MSDFIQSLFFTHSSIQAVIVIFLIVMLGLMLGKIKIGGISLGVTFVFLVGIFAGHLGLNINRDVLNYAQDFGLIIFIYALGLQVGPAFFNAFKKGGLKLNSIGLLVIFVGTLFTWLFSVVTKVSLPDMVGILCGATTNTPALGAAQETLRQLGLDDSSLALGCAVTYPMGVIGLILAIGLMKKLFVKEEHLDSQEGENNDTFIAKFEVTKEEVIGLSIMEIAALHTKDKFIISRIWRKGKVSLPNSRTILQKGDRLLIVTREKDIKDLVEIFGPQENQDWNDTHIDWNTVDTQLISRAIIVTQPEMNGRRIGDLRFRNRFGVNVSRVIRAGHTILATPDLVLAMGDTMIVVGEKKSIEFCERKVGGGVKYLHEPNIVSICVGIVLGLILGAIPLAIPGISSPVKLGLAGGPIIVGILMGAFGPRIHMLIYVTESANLMLRRLGLAMYLACLGIYAGGNFFETVIRPEGLLWIILGILLTVVPVILIGIISIKIFKIDFGSVCGVLCAAMANPIALSYANDTVTSNKITVSYTTVYPLALFVRIIIAQLLLVFLL